MRLVRRGGNRAGGISHALGSYEVGYMYLATPAILTIDRSMHNAFGTLKKKEINSELNTESWCSGELFSEKYG
jgi:hypothetical protein